MLPAYQKGDHVMVVADAAGWLWCQPCTATSFRLILMVVTLVGVLDCQSFRGLGGMCRLWVS